MRMNTYTGKRFDPMQMTPEDVSLRDIAHALSLLCRGGGHMKYFYTVGLHSLNCAREAASRRMVRPAGTGLSASRCQRSLPIRHYPPGKNAPLQLSGDRGADHADHSDPLSSG